MVMNKKFGQFEQAVTGNTSILYEVIHNVTNISGDKENTNTSCEYVRNILPLEEEHYKIISVQRATLKPVNSAH